MRPHIALLMMVKNEHKRLHVSLQSVVGIVSSVVLYDTGSTDNTIQIATDFCKQHNIPLRLKQGTFVDFSTSRNVSLDFADTFDDIDFLLLLDCNDELRGGNHLINFCNDMLTKEHTGFLVCQHWFSGTNDQYFNIRLVKARKGWRYFGSVHEYMKDTSSSTNEPSFPVVRMPECIVLYQDRTKDDDKSQKRFLRDKELLLQDYKKDPTNTRTVFYLAQTCSCLQHHEDAYYYSRIRCEMGGFEEERFHSFMRCGNESVDLKHDWYDSMKWYIKAYEHSNRVEPLVKLANYYRDQKLWHLASLYCERACKLSYPTDCILFVNKLDYEYNRWHLMGIIGYYANNHELGQFACKKAIEYGLHKEVDEKNLSFYTNQPKPIETKKQFVEKTISELRTKYPTLTPNKLEKKAEMLWKLSKSKK